MRGLIASGIVLVAAASLAAQADKKYDSKDGKYSIAFPGTPTVDSKKAGELTINTAAVEGKGVAYMVIYSDLPADTVKSSKSDDLLESGEKGLVTTFKANVIKSQPMTFGKEKYPARNVTAEIKVDAATLQMRLTIILAGNRVYQVVAMGAGDVVKGPATDKFFDSLELRK